MAKGKPAPFAGVLLSDSAIAKITTDYEARIKVLKLKLERAEREAKVTTKTADEICKAKLDAAKAKRQACLDDKQRQRDLFFQTLKDKKCSHPAWNYLSFIGGAVVAGGLCVGIDRSK